MSSFRRSAQPNLCLQGGHPEHEAKAEQDAYLERWPAESTNRGRKSLSRGDAHRREREGPHGYLADLRNVAGFAADHVIEFGSADFVSRSSVHGGLRRQRSVGTTPLPLWRFDYLQLIN